MNDSLKEMLWQQDVDISQTTDLVGVLEDITEDLYGYDCKWRKAENEQQRREATAELACEYSYYSSRINTLVNLIHNRLLDTQEAILKAGKTGLNEEKAQKNRLTDFGER